MNYLRTVITSAIADFTRNKARTLLTSLGILIGVLAVVLTVALGNGLKKTINDQFESLGAQQLILFPGQVLSNGRFRGSSATTVTRFDERDIATLKRLRILQYVIPVVQRATEVSAGGITEPADLYMTSHEIFAARNLGLQVGRFYTREDVESRKKIVVLGSSIAEKLFGTTRDAVGKKIKTNNQSFMVVGVLDSVGGGGFGGPDFDNFIYLPYKTGYIFNTAKQFPAMTLVVQPGKSLVMGKTAISTVLLKRYKTDDFSIIELSEIQKAVTDIFGSLSVALAGVSAISLIVGGIGIMNIMYVTVSERTKEVGVRRALGARRSDILTQFLVEAVILSLFGGFLGLASAYGIVELVALFAKFPAFVDIQSVLLALGVSSGIGILFGVFPARKASQLSPIEAIRYE